MITYTQYGKSRNTSYVSSYFFPGVSEEVPLEYLRPSQEKGVRDKEKGKDKGESGGLIPIPESLKILPTDTEEVRNAFFTVSCIRIFADSLKIFDLSLCALFHKLFLRCLQCQYTESLGFAILV